MVDERGVIYSPAFYNYLTAWTTVDALAYYTSEGNLHPLPRPWAYTRDHLYGSNFQNATYENTQGTGRIRNVHIISIIFIG